MSKEIIELKFEIIFRDLIKEEYVLTLGKWQAQIQSVNVIE